MKAFNPTDRLSATLEAQQWNQVLTLLGDGPHRVVAPIIKALQEQLQAQMQDTNNLNQEAAS